MIGAPKDLGLGAIAYFSVMHTLKRDGRCGSRIDQLASLGALLGDQAKRRVVLSTCFSGEWRRLSRAWDDNIVHDPEVVKQALGAVFVDGVSYAISTSRGRLLAAMATHLVSYWGVISQNHRDEVVEQVSDALSSDAIPEDSRAGWERFLDQLSHPLRVTTGVMPEQSFGGDPELSGL